MVNAIIYQYYYRNRQQTKIVKDLFIQNTDIQNAKSVLSSIVTEHDNYITSRNITNDGSNFTSLDNKALHHGLLHSETSDTENTQRLATIDALSEYVT